MYFNRGKIKEKIIGKSLKELLKRNRQSGAVTTFLGVVRPDVHRGKKVSKIEYTTYSPMAIITLKNLINEIKKKYGIECVFFRHSLGMVHSGEISLLVHLSSPHREMGIEAVKTLINRMKKEVPIFKKEFFKDGSHFWI